MSDFQWKCHPKAEGLVMRILDQSKQANPFIEELEKDLLKHTSTRLFDWLDHVVVGFTPEMEAELDEVGYITDHASASYRVFHHPGAQLPRIVMRDHDEPVVGIGVSVESIADFLMVRGLTGWIEGLPYSGFRRCCVSTDNGVSLWVVERRGTDTLEPTYPDEDSIEHYLEATEKWKTRPRDFDNEDESMRKALLIAEEIVGMVGIDMAAWIVLQVEREYWQAKNLAGQLQKNRQDRLGMGWANHDHHTFRSSRHHFASLVRLFEILGFHCRERYYTGREAGWGAQIMENSKARLVLFLDVDLSPEEVEVDFAHHQLPELDRDGTIGLWCALHGDSVLRAGMHHLEAQFMFEELKKDLAHQGVGMMDPFSNFPYLKQAFTAGEPWSVCHKRIERLLSQGKISAEQAEKFKAYGAVGSHLENLQRREGYKGFNQKNVSVIIKKTDPRNY